MALICSKLHEQHPKPFRRKGLFRIISLPINQSRSPQIPTDQYGLWSNFMGYIFTGCKYIIHVLVNGVKWASLSPSPCIICGRLFISECSMTDSHEFYYTGTIPTLCHPLFSRQYQRHAKYFLGKGSTQVKE